MKPNTAIILLATLACLAWVSARSISHAAIVSIEAFGPGAIVESFEGLSAGPGLAQIPGTGLLEIVGAVSLDSGVEVRYRTTPQTPALIGDFSLGDSGGALTDDDRPIAETDVPDGSAFLSGVTVSSLAIHFPSPMRRIGMFAIANTGGQRVTLLDSQRRTVVALDVPAEEPDRWASSFLGFEHDQGIAFIEFGGIACRRLGGCGETSLIDQLIFEPVPEPGTLATLIFGGILIACRARHVRIG